MMNMGKLARERGCDHLALGVLPQPGGYVLGTVNGGHVFTVESREVWSDANEAFAALQAGTWTQRGHLVDELSLDVLDRAVALTMGYEGGIMPANRLGRRPQGFGSVPNTWEPTRDVSQAWPLFTRQGEEVWFEPSDDPRGKVRAYIGDRTNPRAEAFGNDRLEAGLRTYVRFHKGNEIHF